MELVVAATDGELESLRLHCPGQIQFLVTGVGLVETTYALTRYLTQHPEVSRVINVGIAGGFASEQISVLDVCIAQSETIADLGICFDSSIGSLDSAFLAQNNIYPCDNSLFNQFSSWMLTSKESFRAGPFLSVNGVSGTFVRGQILNQSHAICENMEGAGVARVCHGFNLDWLELRVVSNLVDDRELSHWQIKPAIDKYSRIMALFLQDGC